MAPASIALANIQDERADLVETVTLDDGGDGATVGDQISYTFDVTNTGNVILTDVAVTDPNIAVISCPGI